MDMQNIWLNLRNDPDMFYRTVSGSLSLCQNELWYFFPACAGKREITLSISNHAFKGSRRIFIVKDNEATWGYSLQITRKTKREYHTITLIPRQIEFLSVHKLLPEDNSTQIAFYVNVK